MTDKLIDQEGNTVARYAPSGEVDIQVSTAKKYPRDVPQFLQEAKKMATLNKEIAVSCFYAKPVGGKTIEGPSARLWEIVSSCWGNLRCASELLGETADGKNVEAKGFCWDLETNVAHTVMVKRRITYKDGSRFPDDLITTTVLAAASIAERNAGFQTVPKVYVDEICNAARNKAIGKAESLNDRCHKIIDYLAKYGVSKERALARVGRLSIEDMSPDNVKKLIELSESVRDGETTLDKAFPPPKDKPKAGKKKTEAREPGQEG